MRSLFDRVQTSLAILGLVASLALLAPPVARAQEHAAGAAPADQAVGPDGAAHGEAAGEHGEGGHEEGGLLSLIAKLFNFAILVGTLVYFLRSPISHYLADRGQQVRQDLVLARQVRETAAGELAAIDQRLQALPGELEALRARGAEEIAAEEERIRRTAGADRERLVDQTRREIDARLRIARRELIREASELAVGVARARLQAGMTPGDQLSLMDRYVNEVGQRHD